MPITYSNFANLKQLNVTGSTILSASLGQTLTVYGKGEPFVVFSGSKGPVLDLNDGNSVNNLLLDFSSGSVRILSIDKNSNITITGSVVVSGSSGSGVFSQGATLADYGSGISNSGSYMVWRAPFPCYVVKVYGYREGGSNAEINAVRSGSGGQSFHTGSNLVLSSANVWTSTNTVQNTDYSIGDSLKIIVSGSGGNNQVAVQVDFLKKF